MHTVRCTVCSGYPSHVVILAADVILKGLLRPLGKCVPFERGRALVLPYICDVSHLLKRCAAYCNVPEVGRVVYQDGPSP